jgi:hypothetical protein
MTYFLLLLPALVVAGLGTLVRRRSVLWGNVLCGVGIAACMGLIGWQVRQSLFTPDAALPNRAQAVVSVAFANQALMDAAGKQGSVVLVFPAQRFLDAATARSYENTFTPLLLRGHPELQVEVVRLEPRAKGGRSDVNPAAFFKPAHAKLSGALAVISYAGFPGDFDEVFPTNALKVPPLYVFDPQRTTNWVQALKEGRIRSVIVPRPGIEPAKSGGVAGDPGDIFNQLYLMATTSTAEQVAGQLVTSRAR